MQCNRCSSGIYEPIGYFEVDEDKGIHEQMIYQRHFDEFRENIIIIFICSHCGDVYKKAGSTVLSLIRKKTRQKYATNVSLLI